MNVPQLRFKEFGGEWEQKKLGEISSKITKKNKDDSITNVLTNSATQGVVNQSDYFEREIANQNNLTGYYIVSLDDFIYNPRISVSAPVGPIKRNKIAIGVMSPLYTVFHFNHGDNKFFEYFFETNFWHEYMQSVANTGARHDRMNITNTEFFNLPLPFPSLEEQTQIANFLTAIDERINQLTRKKELMTQYKQGVMQKIFSQQLRFKDDNGEDFGDWEEKTLGEICDYKNGGAFEKDIVEEGDYYLITLNSIDIHGSLKEDHKKINHTDNSLKSGDLVMVLSDVAHGYFLGITDIIPSDNYVLNQRMGALRSKITLNTFYLKLFINFNQKYFKLKGQGSSQKNLSKGDVLAFNVLLPTYAEQTKIANFLTALDEKIQHITQQIEATKQYKQGLLQQMFV
jgi:type I restriction enzyme S subunit